MMGTDRFRTVRALSLLTLAAIADTASAGSPGSTSSLAGTTSSQTTAAPSRTGMLTSTANAKEPRADASSGHTIPPMKPTSLQEKAGALSTATGQTFVPADMQDLLTLSARHAYQGGRGSISCSYMNGFNTKDNNIYLHGDPNSSFCQVRFVPWKGVKPYLMTVRVFTDGSTFTARMAAENSVMNTDLKPGWNTLMYAIQPTGAQEQVLFFAIYGQPSAPFAGVVLRQIDISTGH